MVFDLHWRFIWTVLPSFSKLADSSTFCLLWKKARQCWRRRIQLWCKRPSHRYFCANELGRSNQGFRRPPIQTQGPQFNEAYYSDCWYENHPETLFPPSWPRWRGVNYTIPSDEFSKNFATDSATAQKWRWLGLLHHRRGSCGVDALA